MTNSTQQGGDWPTTHITLLRRIADESDRDSWDCFEQTYGPLVHRYCQRRGMQDSDARDVVQEVLLQVSRGIARFRYDAERGKFRNWLGTVTHRAMLKHLEKQRRPGVGGGDLSQHQNSIACQQPLDADWIEAFNSHVYRTAVRRLRLEFSQESWLAFERVFVEDHVPETVATELKRSIGWVYQAKSKILRRLRQEIVYLAEDSILLNLGAERAPQDP